MGLANTCVAYENHYNKNNKIISIVLRGAATLVKLIEMRQMAVNKACL